MRYIIKPTLLIIILLLVCLGGMLPLAQDNFDVQGHRGARALKPENTLPAFEAALDLEVTTLEMDLHFTADGEVVVWHDAAISDEKCTLPDDNTVELPQARTPFGNPYQISTMTREQVQAFRCDQNPDTSRFPNQDNAPTALAGDDYTIPTLRDVFTFVETYAQSDVKSDNQRDNAARVQFNIETKRQPNRPAAIGDDFEGDNAGAFELAILALVEEFELTERVIIQSFDHRSIWAIKAANPDSRVAALTTNNIDLVTYAKQGAEIWSPRYTTITPENLAQAHELGLLVIPWTVNDSATMRDLIALGVDGIITDAPNLLLAILEDE